MPTYKAVILIAGPQKGTRFRPLSLDIPKPLFPVAGIPIIHHHIEACAKVAEIKEILVLGFYPASEMASFIQDMINQYNVSIRYLQEYTPLGTAGGIYHFRDQIRAGNPDAFFLLNGDVCADFPLQSMLDFHNSKENCVATMMGTEATRQQSVQFGCIVEDKVTHSILHYVEKPETYVSTLINCGVYIFSQNIFSMLQDIFSLKQKEHYSSLSSSDPSKRDAIWIEKDLMVSLAGTGKAYVYQTSNWWSQIKTAGSAIYANRHYLQLYAQNGTLNRLAKQKAEGSPVIQGDVFIHPTAKVDETAVLGPNVSIGCNVKIGAGARIRESIVLSNCVIGDHTLVKYSVIGQNSLVGDWTRVEGTPDDPDPNKPFAMMETNPLFNSFGQMNPSITILGGYVVVPSEVIIFNSIVLPHKELNGSHKNQIIL